ncbi:cytochrome P450 [Thozetella sp. PMI_491]|nr:cytochrome P450 [Thozetella sp. PMI_491]
MESLSSFLTWRSAAGAAGLYYASLVFYRLFFDPLARFPGPKLAAISRWYEAYYDMIQNGQYTAKIEQMHKKYGPIVRISPYELHIHDPAYFEKLYRHDGRWDKYAWSIDAFTAPGAAIWTPSHEVHRARRQPLNPYFSKAKVAARQDVVNRNVDKLCARMAAVAGKGDAIDLGAATSAFSRDIAIEYIIHKQHNSLDKEDFNVLMTTVFQDSGHMWRVTKHVRWFGPAIISMPIDWAIKNADEGTKAFLTYVKEMRQYTQEILNTIASSPVVDDKAERTVLHEITASDLPDSEKKFERVVDDVATLGGAGFETPATVLRLVFFHVFSSPEILRRLRDELSTALQDVPKPVDVKVLEKLPYLTAVLMEGLRLSPGQATRTQRIAPDRDLFYNDYRIPAGTPVGMTTLLLHTDPEVYPDPLTFNPDRWMDPTERKKAEKTWFPFLRGTRMCIGMHLAWAEMYLLLATLVQKFDFEFVDRCAEDFECTSDQFLIGTKSRGVLKARVTSIA